MADRTIHYEAAFEGFLRHRRIPYVAVDEAKKALFANAKLKSFDFVAYPPEKPRLLIDVKGRSLRNRAKRSGFETWATEADVSDLLQWEQVFGEGFTAIFAFVYWIDPPLFGPRLGGAEGEEGRTSNVQRLAHVPRLVDATPQSMAERNPCVTDLMLYDHSKIATY